MSTISNLYLANSLAAAVSEPILYRLLILHVQNVIFLLLRSYQIIIRGPWQVFMFHNQTSFYVEELTTSRPTPKLEDHPLSVVRDWLFNIFLGTFHIGGGGDRSGTVLKVL